ncbi:hypothetical protein scyTo_0004743, partial [Scyliorhinus torazame]|nr:hypothetical protein [Scyliorhinus torazame]
PLKMPINKSSQKDLAQLSSITPAVSVASNHLDLKWINITCLDEAFRFLKIGNKNRSLACTKINQQSSRRLSLCDLAGSERCDKAESFGDRLKEAGNINTSLLILGKCISALRQKQQNKLKSIVIPFRESKLTRLFQAFFCGKGKACMIININQCASIYDETLHVLKFSAIAKQIVQIIRPKVDLQPSDPMKGSDASMMVCTDLSETLSAEYLFSKDEQEQDYQELDAATLGYEELLALVENLKQKLVAERQHKMVLEIRVRKEMGEAMFHQLLRTEEVWSERFEELKEIYEEQLESKLHMYKESIRRHAYKCALVEVQEKYFGKEEFATVRHKVKVAALDEELETMFDENRRKPAVAAHSDELLEELAWFKVEVSKKESQLQSLQLEATISGNEVNQYKELYRNKVLSEEQSARLLEEKDQVTKNLLREMKEMHIALQQAEKNCQERNEEVKKLNRTIMTQEIKEEYVDQIQQLQNVVSKLQEELALSTKPPRAEKPPQTAKRLFANLTGSKLALGSPSKNSLFKSRELTPRIKVKKNIVSGKLPSIPSKTNE